MLIKSFAAVAAASVLGAGSAFAGPYVNIETNAGYTGNDYNSAVTDFHVGYEGPIGEDAGYYVQAGPAIVAADGVDTTTEFSGKAGVGVDIAENVNVYGEVSFITIDDSDDNGYGLKAGVKYTF
jgi:outer membrane autotransporter protein